MLYSTRKHLLHFKSRSTNIKNCISKNLCFLVDDRQLVNILLPRPDQKLSLECDRFSSESGLDPTVTFLNDDWSDDFRSSRHIPVDHRWLRDGIFWGFPIPYPRNFSLRARSKKLEWVFESGDWGFLSRGFGIFKILWFLSRVFFFPGIWDFHPRGLGIIF